MNMTNNAIDWEDVENKISLICCKFSNLSSWHDDLAQELRIHAYYKSDNYYDLYRKAIDFWRKLQSKQFPETPYFDLDVLGNSYVDKKPLDQTEKIIFLVKEELNRTPPTKWEGARMQIAMRLLDIILEDIDPTLSDHTPEPCKSSLNHYINRRLNLSWVSEETGIGYKQLITAMKVLEDIIRGLHAMKKIEIPLEYFEGYFEE